jgi:serine O-acetyltransferase
VVGIPGRVVTREGEKEKRINLRTESLPDPLIDALNDICVSIDNIEHRLEKLEQELKKQ